MAIVPSGQMRLMVAQNMDNSLYNAKPAIEPAGVEEIPEVDPSIDTSPEVPEVDPQQEVPQGIEHNQKSKTLTDFIYKKLEEFGYPGRRLEDFKKKFVNETISPDGAKNVTVEIPDKKYPNPQTGETETVEAEDLSKIVGDIEKIFGLHFNGAKRSDARWTINMTSVKAANPEDGEMVRDNLDEVYGTPSKQNKKEPETVRGFTIRELIKSAKVDFITKLKKIIGGDHAS